MRWFDSLRRSGEIAYVRRSGSQAGAPTLRAHAVPLRGGPSRIAIAVSKSVGGAVVRNAVKRRIKGALDEIAAPARSVRIVIVARPEAAAAPYERLARDVEAIVRLVTR